MRPLWTAEEIHLREVLLPSPPSTTTQLTCRVPSTLSAPSRELDHPRREKGPPRGGSGSAGQSRQRRGDSARRPRDTHRDEDAVEIPRLPRVLAGSHDGRQLGHVVHPHDIDVVLAAEGLDQSEVDLQGYVPLVLLVRGQHAERDVVGVAARGEQPDESRGRRRPPRSPAGLTYTLPLPPPPYSHIHQLGRLVDAGGEAASALRRHQQLVEGRAGALHPAGRERGHRISTLPPPPPPPPPPETARCSLSSAPQCPPARTSRCPQAWAAVRGPPPES